MKRRGKGKKTVNYTGLKFFTLAFCPPFLIFRECKGMGRMSRSK